MTFDEMCDFSYRCIMHFDGEGIGTVYDMPDYYVFTSAARGYGFPSIVFPKDGGESFFMPPVGLEGRNRVTKNSPKIPFPSKYHASGIRR